MAMTLPETLKDDRELHKANALTQPSAGAKHNTMLEKAFALTDDPRVLLAPDDKTITADPDLVLAPWGTMESTRSASS